MSYNLGIILERDGEDLELIAKFKWSGKYIPERRYMSNGDPGYEAEYPEMEVISVKDLNGKVYTSADLTSEEEEYIYRKCEELEIDDCREPD